MLLVFFNNTGFCYKEELVKDAEIESIKSSTQYGESNLMYKNYRPDKDFTYKEFSESADGITVNIKKIDKKRTPQDENKWIMRSKKCPKCPISSSKKKKPIKKKSVAKKITKKPKKSPEKIRTIIKKIIIYRESEKEAAAEVNVNVINQLNESEIRCE